MTTQDYLAGFGVNMEQAQTFIMENLDDIETIYNVCQQFGVNNDMIADVIQTNFPGLTGAAVSNAFSSNGFNGNALGFNAPIAPIAPVASQNNLVGTLNLSNIDNYSQVILFENVSLATVHEYEDYAYLYASNDTWNSISDLGFTDNYSQMYDGAVEFAYSNDYTTMAFGYDLTQTNAQLTGLMAQNGVSSGEVGSYIGSYDLIIAM